VVGSLENGLLAMALRKSQKIEIGSESEINRRIAIVREQWMILEKRRGELEKLRQKVFAHFELNRKTEKFEERIIVGVTFKGEFETFSAMVIPSLSEICAIFDEVIPVMARCLEALVFILVRANFHSRRLRQQATNAANLFWKAQRVG
jgi:hypothetical protein